VHGASRVIVQLFMAICAAQVLDNMVKHLHDIYSTARLSTSSLHGAFMLGLGTIAGCERMKNDTRAVYEASDLDRLPAIASQLNLSLQLRCCGSKLRSVVLVMAALA
jgi:hypothetical protein